MFHTHTHTHHIHINAHTHTPQAAVSMLKQEYGDPPKLKEAMDLAVRVLYKTLDSTKLTSEKGRSVFFSIMCDLKF